MVDCSLLSGSLYAGEPSTHSALPIALAEMRSFGGAVGAFLRSPGKNTFYPALGTVL